MWHIEFINPETDGGNYSDINYALDKGENKNNNTFSMSSVEVYNPPEEHSRYIHARLDGLNWNKYFMDGKYSITLEFRYIWDTDGKATPIVLNYGETFYWGNLILNNIGMYCHIGGITTTLINIGVSKSANAQLDNFSLNLSDLYISEVFLNTSSEILSFLKENNKTYLQFIFDILSNPKFINTIEQDVTACLDLIHEDLVSKYIDQ